MLKTGDLSAIGNSSHAIPTFAISGQIRGRIFATEFIFFYLCSAIASTAVGGALDLLSISGVIWWMAGLSLLPVVLWSGWLVRRPLTR